MSETNSPHTVEGLDLPDDTDDVDRMADVTKSWESSPLTDPVDAMDPAARSVVDHGDTDVPEAEKGTQPRA